MPSYPSDIPKTGFVRLLTILDHIPVSKSTWWAGCRDGRYPPSVKIGPGITAWRAEDIRTLIANPGVPWIEIPPTEKEG